MYRTRFNNVRGSNKTRSRLIRAKIGLFLRKNLIIRALELYAHKPQVIELWDKPSEKLGAIDIVEEEDEEELAKNEIVIYDD